jgi:DNA-binding transcriptional MerR regulator
MSSAPAVAVRMKSPEAFRSISEVSTELDVPQHVLRFWESRFNQVRPLKRGGGRRFYRPEDVDLLRGIRTLLYHDGYTIKGVQKVLRERGPRYVAEIGRNDAMTIADREIYESAIDIPEDSMDALVTLARMHAEAAESVVDELASDRRADLEILLEELLVLKSRLRAAREDIG